jgi:hypothetical protein
MKKDLLMRQRGFVGSNFESVSYGTRPENSGKNAVIEGYSLCFPAITP